MFQQIIALIIIAFFLSRLILEFRHKQISRNEFFFWLIFWILGAIIIIGLKWFDSFVAGLGFTGSGINIIFYIAVIALFHLTIKQRMHIYKLEKNITKIVRAIALKEEK